MGDYFLRIIMLEFAISAYITIYALIILSRQYYNKMFVINCTTAVYIYNDFQRFDDARNAGI